MPLDGPDLGRLMYSLAKAVEGSAEKTTVKAAKLAQVAHEREIARASGGDSMLSGVNKAKGRPGNAKVGSRMKVTRRGVAPEVTLAATGPLQIIENDTAGHVIRSAYSKGRSRKGFVGPTVGGQFSGGGRGAPEVLNIPGVGFRRWARHPGTKGKKPWAKGRKVAAPVIAKTMKGSTNETIKGNAKP